MGVYFDKFTIDWRIHAVHVCIASNILAFMLENVYNKTQYYDWNSFGVTGSRKFKT